MIQSLFIVNQSGEVLIEKHWRGVTPRSICDVFFKHVSDAARPEEVCPIISTSKHYLLHIYRYKLFFLTTMKAEVPPMLVVEFLQRVVEVLFDYFKGPVNEAAIKENFVTVYQILDEMLDNGFPLVTELNILKDLVKPTNLVSRVMDSLSISGQAGTGTDGKLPDGTCSAVPWRKTGLKYGNNEVYFDIIEEIDAIIDCNGMVVSCDVQGTINVNCRLSGMPELTLNFKDPSILDDCSFHPCVRVGRYTADKTLSFIPPDGKFKLMNYSAHNCGGNLPIYVKPSISYSGFSGHIDIMCGQKGQFAKGIDDVTVFVPVDKRMTCNNLTANVGTAKFDEIKKEVIWQIGRIPKDTSPCLSGNLALRSSTTDDGSSVPPVAPTVYAKFRVPMFSVSGVKVDGLSILNTSAKPYKGVRSITKAGKFQIRTAT